MLSVISSNANKAVLETSIPGLSIYILDKFIVTNSSYYDITCKP